MLDIAAGLEPTDAAAARSPIMVVNLLDRSIMGLSSRNLSVFLIAWLLWMIHIADLIWLGKRPGRGTEENRIGFPTVMDLSFASQAVEKHDDDVISRVVKVINNVRLKNAMRPVHVVVPATTIWNAGTSIGPWSRASRPRSIFKFNLRTNPRTICRSGPRRPSGPARSCVRP